MAQQNTDSVQWPSRTQTVYSGPAEHRQCTVAQQNTVYSGPAEHRQCTVAQQNTDSVQWPSRTQCTVAQQNTDSVQWPSRTQCTVAQQNTDSVQWPSRTQTVYSGPAEHSVQWPSRTQCKVAQQNTDSVQWPSRTQTVYSGPAEHRQCTVIVGDFNSHSPSWGYPSINAKGEEVEHWIVSNRLVLINTPTDPPTFNSRVWKTTSTPDIAIATDNIQKIAKEKSVSNLEAVTTNL